MTIFSCERETDTLFAIVVVPDYNRARTKSGRSEHEKREWREGEKRYGSRQENLFKKKHAGPGSDGAV